MAKIRSSRPKVFCKKVFLTIAQSSQENICARVYFLIELQFSACNFIEKKTQAPVFSSKICEIFKNTNFEEYLRMTSVKIKKILLL